MNAGDSYFLLMFWLISVFAVWDFKEKVFKSIENQYRCFLYYTLASGLIVLLKIGEGLGIPKEAISNLTPELIGMIITVFVIDRINQSMSSRNEDIYRAIALRACKTHISIYCLNWFFIFEPDQKSWKAEILKYKNLEEFFLSDEFYRRVAMFDFNKSISTKKYSQYYNEKFLDVAERFQNTLAKYASKLSHNDLSLIEHFTGRAYFFTVFAVMKFLGEVKISSSAAVPVHLFINKFKDVDKENFKQHFLKLLDLINAYNSVVDNEIEKWTLESLAEMRTIEVANKTKGIEW